MMAAKVRSAGVMLEGSWEDRVGGSSVGGGIAGFPTNWWSQRVAAGGVRQRGGRGGKPVVYCAAAALALLVMMMICDGSCWVHRQCATRGRHEERKRAAVGIGTGD